MTEETIFVYDATGKLIAEHSNEVASSPDAKIAYLTNDHLGSPRINTDINGNVTARHDYNPFGGEVTSSNRVAGIGYADDSVREQFTGYQRDKESDLDYAQARYYSSPRGRFTSVDPIMMEIKRLADPQALNLYVYTRNSPLRYVDPDGEKYKGTDGNEVIIEKEEVNGKKVWVIKSDNASNDLQRLVALINDSGSKTANKMFDKLNKHETMINIVIDTNTSLSEEEKTTGTTEMARHQPHDANGALTINNLTGKFDGKAEPANSSGTAYKEATITLYEKKMEERGYSGERLNGKLVSKFGHEARHDLDPIQVQAGLTGTGSDSIWHPEKNGKYRKNSPDYLDQKIGREIERAKRIRID